MNIKRFIFISILSGSYLVQAGSSFWGAFGGSALGSAFGNIVTHECHPRYHRTVVIEEPTIIERPIIRETTDFKYQYPQDYENLKLELTYERKRNRKLECRIAELEKTIARLERIITKK